MKMYTEKLATMQVTSRIKIKHENMYEVLAITITMMMKNEIQMVNVSD